MPNQGKPREPAKHRKRCARWSLIRYGQRHHDGSQFTTGTSTTSSFNASPFMQHPGLAIGQWSPNSENFLFLSPPLPPMQARIWPRMNKEEQEEEEGEKKRSHVGYLLGHSLLLPPPFVDPPPEVAAKRLRSWESLLAALSVFADK